MASRRAASGSAVRIPASHRSGSAARAGVHRPDLGVRQHEELLLPRSPRSSAARDVVGLDRRLLHQRLAGRHRSPRASGCARPAGTPRAPGRRRRRTSSTSTPRTRTPRAWSRRTAPRRGWSAGRPRTRSRRTCRCPARATAGTSSFAARTCAMTLTCHEVSHASSGASASRRGRRRRWRSRPRPARRARGPRRRACSTPASARGVTGDGDAADGLARSRAAAPASRSLTTTVGALGARTSGRRRRRCPGRRR